MPDICKNTSSVSIYLHLQTVQRITGDGIVAHLMGGIGIGTDMQTTMNFGRGVLAVFAVVLPPVKAQNLHTAVRPGGGHIVFK